MIVETPSPSWTVYAHIAPNGKMYVGITKATVSTHMSHGSAIKGLHYEFIDKGEIEYGASVTES